MKNAHKILLVLILFIQFESFSQSDLYNDISNATWMKTGMNQNCDSLPGDTQSEVICLGKEFLGIDSELTELINQINDQIIKSGQESWEKYRYEQARLAKNDVENNLGKIDYVRTLIIVTRNRIETIKSIHENY
jgi:uncharacterized protein YecT (DUF1311 family)